MSEAQHMKRSAPERVLIVTWLFGYPWDPTRGIYNQQQFDRLARTVSLCVLVAVPWTVALRNWKAFARAGRASSGREYPVRYFISLHLPGAGRSLSGILYFASLVLQRSWTILRFRPTCLVGSWAFPDGVATSAFGRLMRVPVVLKVHGSDVNLFTRSFWRRLQIRLACNAADKVVCVSRALADRLAQIGVKPERLDVIYNGVDPKRFAIGDRDSARASLGIPPSAPIVLFVGNLLNTKGAADLFDAFLRLRHRRPEAVLVFVGDGPAGAGLEERARDLGLVGQVRFTGKLAHAELGKWYAAADLLSLPSHAEGVPNVILEAMACGRPVVATRVGGIPEVLPDYAGRLVEPKNPQALADALEEALSSRWDTARIVAHAAAFTWERNVSMMDGVVRRAATRRSAGLQTTG